MKSLHRYLILPVALLAFGCKGSDSKKVDDALNSDLSLASQAQPYTAADSVSAAERANALTATAPAPAAPVQVTHRTVVHHVYQRSGGSYSSGSSGSYSRGTVARGPIDHVEKHPGRDAAIGAAAGAVLGATTSRDKVKGGLIGAAAGGILGAVIGNNVDKRKVPNY
jgi:hypothetical protein